MVEAGRPLSSGRPALLRIRSRARARRRLFVQRLRGTSRQAVCLLFAILLLAALIRIPKLANLPAGLFCDEAALGYNAWAILHHGVDENGKSMPLFVWSFGGYKNPVFIYASTIPIGLFGLNEGSLRLTSAGFGLLTILALFFLGKALRSTSLGLWSAFFLAIAPWHIHFSRVAFELISFPALFIPSVVLLVRFVQGRRTLRWAFFLAGLCLYSYAIAKLFVPLFLAGYLLLHAKAFWRRRRETLWAVVVFSLTVLPVFAFDFQNRGRSQDYFRNTTILRPGRPALEVAADFGRSYLSFFQRSFLFENGDPLIRHAVPGHGELSWVFLPLLAAGLVALVWWRPRASWLVPLWLALYPVGASLMTETPSASRAFIGVAAFCLLAGFGATFLTEAAGRLHHLVAALATAAILGVSVAQTVQYLDLYVNRYPSLSAHGIGGFQYGYRQVLEFMEKERTKYPLLLLTTTEANQAQIFPLFYNRVPPNAGQPSIGYLVLSPAEFARYSLEKPVLAAVREADLGFFSDVSVKERVLAPAGHREFLIVEIRRLKQFFTSWKVLGPFFTDTPQAPPSFIPADAALKRSYKGPEGRLYWEDRTSQFLVLRPQALMREKPASRGTACGYFLASVSSPLETAAYLELRGTENPLVAWWNGVRLTESGFKPKEAPQYHPVQVKATTNTLLLLLCRVGDPWELYVRLTDTNRRDLSGVRYGTTLPEEPPLFPVEAGDSTPVEGFREITAFNHSGPYSDYRGSVLSHWTYGKDEKPEVAWKTTAIPGPGKWTAVFTASMGEESSTADLWIGGEYALTFDLGLGFTRRTWSRGGIRLDFVSKGQIAGHSGVFYLTVPPSLVTPGEPLELRVTPSGKSPDAWFMVKSYTDTARFENADAGSLKALLSQSWTSDPPEHTAETFK
jgi:4-amino-4-deoxy-L-arabinose transferase-like glycosyltransferase